MEEVSEEQIQKQGQPRPDVILCRQTNQGLFFQPDKLEMGEMFENLCPISESGISE